MENLVNDFLKKRKLSDTEVTKNIQDAIYFLEKSNEIVVNLRREKKAPVNSLISSVLQDMYEKNYEYLAGVISCFLIGEISSSEALCRTAVEGAVNLEYISSKDSLERIGAHFKGYLKTEKKQNENWEKSVEKHDISKDAKKLHLQKITDKNRSLKKNEEVLKKVFSQFNIDFENLKLKWPNGLEKFRALDNEIGYRTVYVALCSQAHNDPEDLLNLLMNREARKEKKIEKDINFEKYHFTLYIIYIAILYHIKASTFYLTHYEVFAEELAKLHNEVLNATEIVVKNGIGNQMKMIKKRL